MTTESNDIHALSGAYAVDALDDRERTEFEHHLAGCETCREEVDSLQESLVSLASLTEATPPPALRDRLMAEIATVRPLPPEVPARVADLDARRSSRRAGRPRRTWLAAAGIAAAVGVLGTGLAVTQPWEEDSSEVRLTAVERVMRADDAQSFSAALAGGGSVRVYRSVAQDRAAVVLDELPPLPSSKVYEMWLQDERGAMVPAGLVPAGRGGSMVLEGTAATAQAVGITVEPSGGSHQPTTDPLAVVVLQG